jgi:hypothetical protein
VGRDDLHPEDRVQDESRSGVDSNDAGGRLLTPWYFEEMPLRLLGFR